MAEDAGVTRPKRGYAQRRTAAATTRRPRASGNEVVDDLNRMISELINENRKLRRQVKRLSALAAASTSSIVEKGLRSIQRRLERATGARATTRRRRIPASSSSGGGRRRRRSPRTAARTSSSG